MIGKINVHQLNYRGSTRMYICRFLFFSTSIKLTVIYVYNAVQARKVKNTCL